MVWKELAFRQLSDPVASLATHCVAFQTYLALRRGYIGFDLGISLFHYLTRGQTSKWSYS